MFQVKDLGRDFKFQATKADMTKALDISNTVGTIQASADFIALYREVSEPWFLRLEFYD